MAWACGFCGESSSDFTGPSIAERLAVETGSAPLDYSDPDLWGCSGIIEGDACDHEIRVIEIAPDGSTREIESPARADTGIDCFYIYPTVDWNLKAGNHDDLTDVLFPELTIRTQAARFSEVCRVYAPYYRQGTIGSYSLPGEQGATIFKQAFSDVAAAFEYYLREWNDGRKLIIMGHSQGAQMASYLLHRYFDGDTPITGIRGSETSRKLRDRLVVALPIGFGLFTPVGEKVGGSFSDIPLCSSVEETGCLIHYRSYPEGYDFKRRGSGAHPADEVLAREGFLHKVFDSATDRIACVNPAMGEWPASHLAQDADGNALTGGDIRLLEGSTFAGLFSQGGASGSAAETVRILPDRYTTTCRTDPQAGDYLAIGFHIDPAVEDTRGDPFGVEGADSLLGLHLYDFNLAQGDLIEQIRIKSAR